ncbi:MAG: lipid A deacylase LpxR family protein [Gammaproteobacteria bacterium]
MLAKHIWLAVLFSVFPLVILADDEPPHESWTFSFGLENDLFANTDRFYTNGIQLNWISPELEYFEDLKWIRDRELFSQQLKQLIGLLPYSDDPTRQRHFSFSLGQKIFTPENIQTRTLQRNDRPYAGWLYGDIGFHTKNKRRLDTYTIQLGLIGDISLGEQAQDLVHAIRDIDKANGWDNQLENELGFALVYDHKRRLFRRNDFYKDLGFDTIVHAGGSLGTVFTNLTAGAEFRLGWNLPTDFGSALIRPAGNTNAPTDARDPRYEQGKQSLSVYFFAATNGRVVLRDIFLDGNTFSDSHSVDKKTLVGEYILGSAISYRSFKLSYAQVFRSREFDQQRSGQSFGSVSISYTY